MPIVGQQYANGFRPYSSFRQQQQQGVSNGFTRQQPWRSSYCSSNRHRLPDTHLSPHQQQQQRNVKPLTPKLIRRIENTCANNATSSRYGKPRAPAPPANQLLQSRKQNPATGTHQAPAANPSQKRAYQATNGRCAKENCPATTTTRNAQRSSKNYPAPLPPQQQQRKQPNDLIAGKATPLAQRRQLPATPKLSLRQRAAPAEGGGSSTGSSDSHDSPKLKKAFSKKFPQGLPFEDEFYGHRNRSYSQSSSNYSFYSSVGAQTTTPHDEDDDEFQRKPATDEALYVDFSKVVHSHKQQRQYVPASSWIRASPDHNELCHRSPTTSHNGAAPLHSTPAQQRRKSAKYARSMHEYLYSDDAKNTTTTMTKHRLSVVDEPEDGYYSYAAGTPEPQTPRTDIYVAAASWAPKPLYPDRVLLPAAADSNNNCSNNNSNLRHSRHQQQQTRRRSEHLGSTTCEYK
ncbi:uncharacterized protein LOC116805854 [Drosophila grimshawi]|uniref:uncharacterized protein LOC116805854 n=1 Tax=Drosophila grimshawi TaxID=7222 RepID=UPI001C933BE4|nr:uncharacterized protein LOC116805854 [Drosophila grimshawi]